MFPYRFPAVQPFTVLELIRITPDSIKISVNIHTKLVNTSISFQQIINQQGLILWKPIIPDDQAWEISIIPDISNHYIALNLTRLTFAVMLLMRRQGSQTDIDKVLI